MHHIKYRQRGIRLQAEWEEAAKHLMSEGRFFAAFEEATEGLQHYPASRVLQQIKARALLRTGGLEEAKLILEGLLPPLLAGQDFLSAWAQSFQEKIVSQEIMPEASPQILTALRKLLQEVQCRWLQTSGRDEETIGLLARIDKDLWRRSGDLDQARKSQQLYELGYCTTGGYWTGINAATMSFICGETDRARELASQVIAQCQQQLPGPSQEEAYWLQATIGEGHLLLGQMDEAAVAYTAAAALVDGHYDRIVSSRQQLRLLRQHGVAVPEAIFAALQPPTVVVCTGHMLDQPDRFTPRFPAPLVPAVREALDRELAALNARIGFSGAACGADLLFLEALHRREARTTVVLPFAVEDYRRASVAFAGPEWLGRFRTALRMADSVRFVTTEKYLGDDELFRFANQITVGLAYLSAQRLDTQPYLLAVWDGVPSDLPGGTADLVSRWPEPDRLRLINLAALQDRAGGSVGPGSPAPPPPTPPPPPPDRRHRRVIKTLLFADIHQFSKIAEEHLPFYVYEFLEHLARQAPPPEGFVNTWGDAIFVALNAALPLLDYAFALRDAVVGTDWRQVGLPADLTVRIALHAGPVFQAKDAITGRDNLYGTHVNRAARLEPTTPPGKIYASEQFAALLLTEQQAAGTRRGPAGQPLPQYICDYAGILSLPKEFGRQPVFHVRRLSEHEAGCV